ncbi:dihydropteroate synthase [Desulfovibrio sp. 86]|uniref:Dihydropteroate synthase n=2 Tax=uncultured Desulfovibrio sp. TaxID=167968 RepID=A0A212L9R5_9BACT|nr:7,8-dihydropteroate synthase [uncultured Desulfovibrio sp.]VZH34759.1 7,8-dihydropteroate synthase [Desulfovibrio sp. 86]
MKNAFPAASVEDATWYVKGGRALKTPSPFGVMGIVNLTPDSFYDGGVHHMPPAGLEHALTLLEQGADILDLGAESSRPGAAELPPDEEIQRLAPVLMGLRRQAPWASVSVDTYHAATAAAVLEQGAVIINDISACAFDPGLLDVLVQYKPGYVLMHSQGRPETMQHNPRYEDVRREVREFFERNLARLVRAGLPEDRIVLDPGIGFGKTLAHNLELLAHPEDWLGFGRPVLMALSMKSVFGGLLSLPPARRGAATVAATALLRARGIFWHRVHHVADARQALAVATAFGGA